MSVNSSQSQAFCSINSAVLLDSAFLLNSTFLPNQTKTKLFTHLMLFTKPNPTHTNYTKLITNQTKFSERFQNKPIPNLY